MAFTSDGKVPLTHPPPLTESNVTIVKFDVVQGWERLNLLLPLPLAGRTESLLPADFDLNAPDTALRGVLLRFAASHSFVLGQVARFQGGKSAR